ncbi:MAG: hypothetical protein WCR76_00015 [Sphaerochaetaceae bacterium]
MKSSQNWDLGNVGTISSDKIQRNIREVTVYLDNDIRQITGILRRYAPLEMMKLASWEAHRSLETGSDEQIREAFALVRFLQNSYCFASMGPSTDRNIPEKEYRKIVSLFDDVFRKCCRYIDNSCLAARNAVGAVKGSVLTAYQDTVMEFCFPSPVRLEGIQYRKRALHFSLQPFNDAISQTFDCGLDGIINALSTLMANGRTGLDTLRDDGSAYKRDMEGKVNELKALNETYADEKDLLDHVVKKEHWENRVQSLIGRRDGYDLYEVTRYTSLDAHDLSLLSVPLCSNEGDASLYPVDDRVNASNPFLEVAGHYYCFDTNHLLDDLPRIVKEQILSHGILSADEWDKRVRENLVLQPVMLVHTLFGSSGFDLHKTGFDALFDFASKQIGLKVLPFVVSDPLAEGRFALQSIAESRQGIAWAKTRRIPVIVVDENHVDDFPLELVDNVLFLTYPQLVGLSQDPDAIRKCKEALGLIDSRQDEDEELDAAESILRDDAENDEDVPVEEEGEPDEPDEPDLSILKGEVIDDSIEVDKRPDDELDEDDAKEMIDPHEDDELPPQEKHEETSKPYSFFTLLSEIANGRGDESPVRQGGDSPDWPAKTPEAQEQPDLFLGSKEVIQAAAGEPQKSVPPKPEGPTDLAVPEALKGKGELPPPQPAEEKNKQVAQSAPSEGEPSPQGPVEDAKPSEEEETPNVDDVMPEIPEERKEAEPLPDPPKSEDGMQGKPSAIDVALEGKTVPFRMKEILGMLDRIDGRFFLMCKEGDARLLSATAGLIDRALEAQRTDGKDKLFTIGQFELTVILSAGRDDQVSLFDRKANIGAILYADKKDSWDCVTLEYGQAGILLKAKEEEIQRKSFSTGDWKYISTIGERLLEKRKKHE